MIEMGKSLCIMARKDILTVIHGLILVTGICEEKNLVVMNHCQMESVFYLKKL